MKETDDDLVLPFFSKPTQDWLGYTSLRLFSIIIRKNSPPWG